MHITHFIATNFLGGPERQILAHLRTAGSDGNEFSLLSFDEPGGREIQEAALALGVPVTLLPAGKWSVFGVLRQLLRFHRKRHIDVICAHGYKAAFYAMLLKFFTGCRFISFFRGWTAENVKIRLFHRLESLVIRFADRIVAVSKSQRRRLKELSITDDKITVVENAVTIKAASEEDRADARRVLEPLGLAKDCRVILTAGRLSPEKGHKFLLEAFDKVADRHPEVHLLIAGHGPLTQALEHQRQQLAHAEQVHLLGFRNDVYQLFLASDLFVLPSLSEGMPNALLEAMALGVPSVATQVGGVPELIDHGVTGWLVPPCNPQALAQAILSALADCNLAKDIVLRAREKVMTEHGAEEQSQRLTQLYTSVMVT